MICVENRNPVLQVSDLLMSRGYGNPGFHVVTKSIFRTVASACVLVLCACTEPERPNIVFILVDDLGWNDVGYHGSSFYETPNIDALSKESVIFSQAYSSGSVCSPSRAAIMTGKHPARINITDWIPGNNPANRPLHGPDDLDQLPLEETTLAERLQDNGYETFFAGKWHLGGEGFLPEDQGFAENHGGHHRGSPPGGYYAPYKNPRLTDGPDGEYLTDRLTQESIDFVEQSGQQPFFLFMSYYTVHTPIQASRRHIKQFEEKMRMLEVDTSATRTEGEGITRLQQSDPAYASMVYAMDENVGRLIDALKEKGIYENTIIVFTSDNGGLTTLRTQYDRLAPTSVAPLRAGKGWLYEGGIRVPLLIKSDAGDVGHVESPVIGHDLFTTLLSKVGIETQVDGVDLSPALGGMPIDRSVLSWHYPHYHGSGWKPGSAVRKDEWKLIYFYESDSHELYNLAEDPYETTNLTSSDPEVFEELKQLLDAELGHYSAKRPVQNPDYSPQELRN